MVTKTFSNVIGFDDAPFARTQAGPIKVVGAIYASLRFDGVMIGEVEKDGHDAADRLTALLTTSKFADHVRLIMLQGITLAGFNVVDVFALSERTGVPVLVVARRQPDMNAVRRALLSNIPAGREKWAVIERLGEMEPAGDVYIQRVGLTKDQADAVVDRFSVYSSIPEPIRTAHLIAGALSNGESRGAP